MNTVRFKDDTEVCSLGQGTWLWGLDPAKRKAEEASLRYGIDLGMQMVDTAEMYNNEAILGQVIQPVRDKVFLVSKVHPEHADFEGTIHACENSLRSLRTDRLDMYLIHWKSLFPAEQTIRAFERLQQDGKIRMWGVSNFDFTDVGHLSALPAEDQVVYNLENRGIEFDLLPWAQKHLVPLVAYKPLLRGELLSNPAVVKVAAKHQVSPAQVCIAWVVRHSGVMAITKASTREHVRENFEALTVQLDATDLRALDDAFPRPKVPARFPAWQDR